MNVRAILFSLVAAVVFSAHANSSELRIEAFLNTKSPNDGPNCWNLALVSGGILPALRYTFADEFSYYMNSPLCRKIANGDAWVPNEIRALRTAAGDELHAYVQLLPGTALTKNGWQKENAYVLEESKETNAVYAPLGFVHDERYECQSLHSFVRDANGIPEEALQFLSILDQTERAVSEETLFGRGLSAIDAAKLKKSAYALKKLLDQRGFENLSRDAQFLIGSYWIRLAANARQLEYINAAGWFEQRKIRSTAESLRELANLLKTEQRGLR